MKFEYTPALNGKITARFKDFGARNFYTRIKALKTWDHFSPRLGEREARSLYAKRGAFYRKLRKKPKPKTQDERFREMREQQAYLYD